MARTIVMEVDYPHPPERVWKALTSADEIAKWLMDNDFEPRVGHRFQLRAKPMPGWSGISDCEVLELDPLRRMVWRWKSDSIDTTVTFTLERVADGTHLKLVHDGFEGVRGSLVSWMMGNGWKGILDKKLRSALETGETR